MVPFGNGMKRIFALLVVFLAAVGVHATDAAPLPEEQLAHVTTFAFGGVGYAGITSSGELAFRGVWKSADAPRIFRDVFDKATPEGRCYALVALRRLSPDQYKVCAKAFRQNPPKHVETMNGCLGEVVSGLQVLQEIEGGHYARFLPLTKPKSP
jgi:hypothetical protein